jgi:DNA-binding HxlR family transcriptional regulator
MVALGKLGSRWSLLVLRILGSGPHRFCEFRKLAPQIPAKSLARVLAKLQEEGLVGRRVSSTRPPHVTYSLTTHDPSLGEAIDALFKWGSKQDVRKKSARLT